MIAYTASKIATREFTAAAPILPTRPQPLHFFAADAEIYGQNEPAGSIYQVEFGAVRVCRLLADGRRQIAPSTCPARPSAWKSATGTISPPKRSATAASASFRCRGGDMSRDLLTLALQSLGRAQDHLLVLARQAACERVGAFLIELAERQGGTNMVELPMSRMDIGDYLGLTIETVSRIFSKLKEQGIIRLPSLRCIEIVRWDALARHERLSCSTGPQGLRPRPSPGTCPDFVRYSPLVRCPPTERSIAASDRAGTLILLGKSWRC